MRRLRNAKIVATLGPASSTRETITALFQAGVDVFRLNFSHGAQNDHRERVETIRQIESGFHTPIFLVPKLSVKTLALSFPAE